MDFVTSLSILANWKGNSYNSILVIVDRLTKMVYYNLVKMTIDTPGLAKVIINIIMQHYGVSKLIVTNQSMRFRSKFWSSLYYFLSIKRKLSTAFHLQTNSLTERQNSTIKAYLRILINWEQDDWAKLLPIVEFTYNNAKILVPVIPRSNSIAATTPKFLSKRMLTSAQDFALLIS